MVSQESQLSVWFQPVWGPSAYAQPEVAFSTWAGALDAVEELRGILLHVSLKEELLSISCGGTSQQWTATGAGALGAADVGMA